MKSEYRSKCGEALWLGVNAGVSRLWLTMWVADKTMISC